MNLLIFDVACIDSSFLHFDLKLIVRISSWIETKSLLKWEYRFVNVSSLSIYSSIDSSSRPFLWCIIFIRVSFIVSSRLNILLLWIESSKYVLSVVILFMLWLCLWLLLKLSNGSKPFFGDFYVLKCSLIYVFIGGNFKFLSLSLFELFLASEYEALIVLKFGWCRLYL